MWKYLLEKEFKQFFRDPGLPRMALMFPVLMMLVFPFAVSMEIRNINLAVVDSDRSEESSRLLERCTSSGYFRLVAFCGSPEEAMRLMDENKADAIITIAFDFSREIGNGSGFPVGIKVNTVNGTRGSIASQYLQNCIMMYLQDRNSREAGSSVQSAASAPAAQSVSAGPAIDVSEKYYFNTYLDYKLFMIPALIVIGITMITAFLPSLNIVSEKETGTIEQMNVTPVSKSAFIICKMIPYWAIAFFVLTACLLIAWAVFGYVCRGNVLWLYLYTTLDIIVMAGLGLLISNYSSNAQQAMFVIWFFAVIFMLMSGIFTPIASMPGWAQAITYLNPMRYYADAMRSVFLKGSSPLDIWYDAAGLASIGAAMVCWAIASYRKSS
ncbi:MAG: ABC transporter permease [Bacteroidetes bacterium]|uniref:ABC transporter permease n=1 Tax=Candidatus Cryptobacteroides gallistercoris TaxID=2840765 RepID=A0A940DMU1_9BACT|nr:ABC transporter permease [Candidatus Cryptobacteroides gallistercoris]